MTHLPKHRAGECPPNERVPVPAQTHINLNSNSVALRGEHTSDGRECSPTLARVCRPSSMWRLVGNGSPMHLRPNDIPSDFTTTYASSWAFSGGSSSAFRLPIKYKRRMKFSSLHVNCHDCQQSQQLYHVYHAPAHAHSTL